MSDRDEFEDEGPSKSELKRQSRDLQDLGDELVALPATELDALELPDDLRDAVIRAALGRRAETDRQRVQREHVIEQWRERLLADESAAWTELGGRLPAGDLQQLRSLTRQARAERDATRPPSAARQLFRRLRDLLPVLEA